MGWLETISAERIVEFGATYLVHSTLIFGAVWLLQLKAGARLREVLWRAALLLPLLTTTARVAWPERSVAPVWSLPQLEVPPALHALDSAPLAHNVLVGATASTNANPALKLAAGPAAAGNADPVFGVPTWIWLVAAGLCFACLRLAVPMLALGRLLHRRRPLAAEALHEELARLRRRAGLLRHVRLYTLEGLASPVAGGTLRPAIYLPEHAVHASPKLASPLLAHELAHHARLDPLWNRITHGIAALFFFQPLHILARRQTVLCAELLADDLAIRWTEDGPALATCLTEVAGWARAGRHLQVGVPMVRRRGAGELRARVERALDRPREMSAAFGLPAASLLATTSVALLPALAGTATDPSTPPKIGNPATPYTIAIQRNQARLEALELSLGESSPDFRPALTVRLREIKNALAQLAPPVNDQDH